MSETVKIELSPYAALAILRFLREFINDDVKDDYQFRAIYEAVEEFNDQIYQNVTTAHLDEALAVNAVNKLIGKIPKQQQ